MEDMHMTDELDHPDAKPETRRRWLRVALIIVAVLILLFIIMKIAGFGGAGGHGPSRHFGIGDDRSLVHTS
jgi:hypothetical protein